MTRTHKVAAIVIAATALLHAETETVLRDLDVKIETHATNAAWAALEGLQCSTGISKGHERYVLLDSPLRHEHALDGFFVIDVNIDGGISTHGLWRIRPEQGHLIAVIHPPEMTNEPNRVLCTVGFADISRTSTSRVFTATCTKEKKAEQTLPVSGIRGTPAASAPAAPGIPER